MKQHVAAMWEADRASHGLGITVDTVTDDAATLSMVVTEAMLNGHRICHGGVIFTLADTAFAVACNARGDRAVAQAASITFLRPGQLGERLMATAELRARAGRSGIFDVRITGGDETVVAEFRGQSRVVR